MECAIAKRILRDRDITTINDVLLEMMQLQEAFPVLVKLLQIALTVVVSTAECERSVQKHFCILICQNNI